MVGIAESSSLTEEKLPHCHVSGSSSKSERVLLLGTYTQYLYPQSATQISTAIALM